MKKIDYDLNLSGCAATALKIREKGTAAVPSRQTTCFSISCNAFDTAPKIHAICVRTPCLLSYNRSRRRVISGCSKGRRSFKQARINTINSDINTVVLKSGAG